MGAFSGVGFQFLLVRKNIYLLLFRPISYDQQFLIIASNYEGGARSVAAAIANRRAPLPPNN